MVESLEYSTGFEVGGVAREEKVEVGLMGEKKKSEESKANVRSGVGGWGGSISGGD